MSSSGAQARALSTQRTESLRVLSSANPRLSYHFLVAVDIEGFSRLSTLEQVEIQTDLGEVLEAAASTTGFDRRQWDIQVSGDGELAVLPPDVDGPCLVADYPRALIEALGAVNQMRRSRLRVRLAIHHGTLAAGSFGPVGQAPIVVSRLLDSDVLRQWLAARSDLDLALIVSSTLHNEVIRSRFRGLDPNAFEEVNVVIKSISYAGYIWIDGAGGPASSPEDLSLLSTKP
jgi:class 3 adenylate cyclase